MIICYALKIDNCSHLSPPLTQLFNTFSRVCIDHSVILKILFQEAVYLICDSKCMKHVTIRIYRIVLSVFDYHKFCQQLLILNVDHPRQTVGAPFWSRGLQMIDTHTYTYRPY